MENSQIKPKNFPTILIIFGATGDLMERKLLPAVFQLYQKGFLPPMFQLIGFSRGQFNQEEYRQWVKKNLPKGAKSDEFLKKVFYQQGNFEDIKSYIALGERLGLVDKNWHTCANKLFYLAVPPNYYEAIFKNLASSGLTIPCSPKEGWTRVLVEKPFGSDLKVAKKLDKQLAKLFKEIQIFRIDHYLAKETIQNILIFRFANSVFENIWNKNYIEKIEIKLLEKNGVEDRGSFYDNLGALRDVGQNHLLQLLALVTMPAPLDLEPESFRRQKLQVLKFLPKMTKKEVAENTVRGQYKDYLKIKGVKPNSKTETYFKIKTSLNHPNWQGVPIYLESGKKMKDDLAEIKITFRQIPKCLFCPPGQLQKYKNTLSFHISPKQGITYCFFAKKPGPTMDLEEKELHFLYKEAYQKEQGLPEYNRLLLDAFLGNQTLFLETKEIMALWEFVDPILKHWQKAVSPLKVYNEGQSPTLKM